MRWAGGGAEGSVVWRGVRSRRSQPLASLASCAEGGWLAPGALVVVEEAQGVEVALPEGFTQLERRDYGETKIVFGRYEGQG